MFMGCFFINEIRDRHTRKQRQVAAAGSKEPESKVGCVSTVSAMMVALSACLSACPRHEGVGQKRGILVRADEQSRA